MNKSSAWLLLVLSPLSASCVGMVSLAERSDDAPVADVPTVDIPVSNDRPDSGPATPDAPSPNPDGGLPYCPVEIDYNAPSSPDLRYRRGAFALLPGAMRPDAGAAIGLTGTWAGTRRLDAPLLVGCHPTDTRAECLVDTVIGVQQTGGTLQEFVVTTPPADLSALTVGIPITVRASATLWDGSTPIRYSGEFVVRRSADDALMLAIGTSTSPPGGLDVPMVVGSAVCTSRPERTCNRTLHAFAVQFGQGNEARTLAPGEEARVNHAGVTYLCRNRVHYQRIQSQGVECSDGTPTVTSLEIVRQP